MKPVFLVLFELSPEELDDLKLALPGIRPDLSKSLMDKINEAIKDAEENPS
jgi:hypothetical protein